MGIPWLTVLFMRYQLKILKPLLGNQQMQYTDLHQC
jgi:hypothetical protein